MSSAVAAGTTGDAGASTLPDPGPGDRGAESSGANADAPSSSGLGSQGRKVSTQDIQLVQNLIERCLQMYMSQREVRLPAGCGPCPLPLLLCVLVLWRRMSPL